MASANVNKQLQAGEDSFAVATTVNYDAKTAVKPTLPAAKTGTLSVRTSASVGTIALAAGHGIATADVIDLYWVENGVQKVRYDVVVGTVSGDNAPITGGGGDDLPPLNTALVVCEQNVETISVVGNNLVGIGIGTNTFPTVVKLAQAGGALILRQVLKTPGETYTWVTGDGVNPAAGVTIGQVVMTHGNSVSPAIPAAVLLHV